MTNTVPEAGRASAAAVRRGRTAFAIVPLATAQLMITLDSTIVSVALPTLQADVGLTDSQRAWAVTAYTLAFGGLLLLGGRLGDLFGRRRALIIGVVGFALSSVVCGAAQNDLMFIGSRGLQGIFAALIAPSTLALITTTYTEARERTRAVGIYAATAMSGGALGLVVGGVLTDYLGWRWCMYVNIPIAVIVVVGSLLSVANPPRHPDVKPDVPGAVLVTLGMVGIIYGLGVAGDRGWASGRTVGALVGGVLVLVAFGWWQARTAHPLLPPRVAANRVGAASFLVMMVAAFCTFGMMLGMTYQLQTVLGYSPVAAGIAFLGFVGTAVVSSTQLGRRLVPHMRPGLMMATGLVLYALAYLLVTRLTPHSSYWPDVFPPLAVMGVGVGILTVPVVGTVMSVSAARDSGVVAAVVNTMQQAGGSVGAALLNTVSISAAARYLASRPDNAATRVAVTVHGFVVSARWSASIALVCAVLALVAVNVPAPRPGGGARAPK
ncbi:major facilitator superfamily MFS_1 [Actinobacteria bacterium OK074]|nr:major facilitator superfamily MFS_1 [Actinobacteria bacterium OK074]